MSTVPLSNDQLKRDLAVRDLTDPVEGPHAIQELVDELVTSLAGRWRTDVVRVRGSRIVTVADNYDRLRIPPDAVSRSGRYTRYVSHDVLLRTHATAMIPAGLRLVDTRSTDVLLVCAGMVYRRDAIDRLHTGTPHQLDLWRLTRTRGLVESDLAEMVASVVDAAVPGRRHRVQSRAHPYTLGGRQVDVLERRAWIEVAECGIAHPDVLADAGLRGWGGLAMGLGLDRLLMIRKGIGDIRLLRAADPRVQKQMLDLAPYDPVSRHPPILRDISVVVDQTDDEETIGDTVRLALENDSSSIESVRVLSRTPFEKLPPSAIDRLGIRPGQDNVLIRLSLRHLERTLTDEEANRLRDRIVGAVHRGSPMV